VEGFYRFRLNSNIAITPGIVWLTNPGNDDDNSDSIAGVVRTTFTF
jgi:carbohydrate-selective porin OprB